MYLAIGLIILGLAIALFSDAALTWDGAYYLFMTLHANVPFVVHDRLIDLPLQWPVLLVNRFTDSLTALRAVFGLIQVITPLVAIAASWWVVGKDRAGLILWPVLGICIGTLPGQIDFISGSLRATQLFWPILLAILIGLPSRTVALTSLTALIIVFTHPVAIPLFATGALAAGLIAYFQPEARGRLLQVAGCFAFATVLRFGMVRPGYDSEAMTWEAQQFQWEYAVFGLPMAVLVGAAFSACASLVTPRVPRYYHYIPLLGVGFAGLALVVWASDSSRWRPALDYRGPALIITLVFMGFATIDTVLNQRYLAAHAGQVSAPRLRTVQAAALVFAVVISIQSIDWHSEIEEMRTAMAESDGACVSTNDIPGFRNSALATWSTPSLSLLYQDWSPNRIVLPPEGCAIASENGTIPLVPWTPDIASNRFDMQPLRDSLVTGNACWTDLSSGWYEVEPLGDELWRWSSGTGVMAVRLEQQGTVLLGGEITTLPSSNRVTIVVNGETYNTIDLNKSEWRSLEDLALDLEAGENTIVLRSEQAAEVAPPDTRQLAFSIKNLDMNVGKPSSVCALR